MDFETILHKARRNEVAKKEPIRYYSTKFEPPKKEQRNKNQVAINFEKFLEKMEQEDLLALRSQDKKAVKRVCVMLKRTKSANLSVIEDAVDSDNTALTLTGPAQPDEDEYGYVSQEASAFCYKMMEKNNKMPEKRKVSTNLNTIKAVLKREKEEALMPHKRKRKHENLDDNSGLGSDEKLEKVEEKHESKKLKVEKPKPKGPPPMSFTDLMKLAEKNQLEPIIIDKKHKEVDNPLTKKQKKELERVREWEKRKNDENKIGKNLKLSHGFSSSKPESAERFSVDSKKPATGDMRKPFSNTLAKPESNDNLRPKASLAKDSLKVSNATNYRQKENVILSQQRPLDRMKPKEFAPRDMMSPKQFPPADMRKPMSRPNKMKVIKGRIFDDDEEEYSEMDDFIDDGPEEEKDYSKHISKIFGYDKSKYANFDDEDDLRMVSSYAQQMKEEVLSRKIVIMEDLEDMKLEEEHKRRKAMMKKKLSKKR